LALVNNTDDNLSEEEEKDLNPSATNNTLTDKARKAENMPTNNTPKDKATGRHLIESFEEFKKCLLHPDYEATESLVDNPTHELIRWHYKLGHELFRHLQWMARSGILPACLTNCRIPQCTACYYGKASKRPWQEKWLANKNKIVLATVPGQIVSVDQMQSTVPGFVGQIKGFPMR
jgi:GAG-pre-integrase domain